MLACYLFSIKDNPALTFLAHGPKVWLEELLPKYALFYPVQTACIQGAIKFLPNKARSRYRCGCSCGRTGTRFRDPCACAHR